MTEIDGKLAYSTLHSIDPKLDLPHFIMFYHPKCPACHDSIDDFKHLGQYVKEHNSKVKIMAVNASKSHEETNAMGVNGYPTFLLITNSKEVPFK